MSAFDKVIGYETVKNEFLQLCDMINNRSVYEELGASMPQGIIIYGRPGIGKTLLAKSFIEESKLKAYVIRRYKGTVDFMDDIMETFEEAMLNAPSIILLDDLDKFANEDEYHQDAMEYVAVQAGIDEVKDSDVFVVATANDINKLPDSLLRSGRFDRKIALSGPTDEEAEKIISYYLSSKKVSESVNREDVAKMISYSSCAELETILNEAAVHAAFARKESVDTDDVLNAVLRMEYGSPSNYSNTSEDELRSVALHEAGHLVVSEVLSPRSVGLASICASGLGEKRGFVHNCKKIGNRRKLALIALGGKAAVELYCCESVASGCAQDISRAAAFISEGVLRSGSRGISRVDVSPRFNGPSDDALKVSETITQAELERCFMQTKDIILKNREFLEKITEALLEKETLLYSDICAIKDSCTVTEVAV